MFFFFFFFSRHFEIERLIFNFFFAALGFLEYFNSDLNFNAKFVRKSMFLMFIWTPLLTTNVWSTEDLDHLSVKGDSMETLDAKKKKKKKTDGFKLILKAFLTNRSVSSAS